MGYSNKLEAWWVSQNSHDQLTWMQFMELRLQHLESQAATPPAETRHLESVTERQEATQPGPSTFSETWQLARAGQNGEESITATVTFHASSFIPTLGNEQRLWLDAGWTLLKRTTSGSPLRSGPTPSEQMQSERVQGGQPASGSIGPDRWAVGVNDNCTCSGGYPKFEEGKWRHTGECQMYDDARFPVTERSP